MKGIKIYNFESDSVEFRWLCKSQTIEFLD